MKKMTLLPLVMLILAACGGTSSSSVGSSIASSTSTSTSTSSVTTSTTTSTTTSVSSEDPGPVITTIQNARLLSEGTDVTIRGVVTRVVRQRNFYVQQGNFGITVFGYEGTTPVAQGDYVEIYGFIGVYNGLVQLTGAAGSGLPEVTFLSGTAPVITPLELDEVTYDNAALAANNDGRLVSIKGLRLKNAWTPLLTDPAYPTSGGVNVDMTLGAKTILARFDRYINVADRAALNTFFGALTVNDKVDYEGILGDFNGIQLAVSIATDFTLNDDPAVLPTSVSVSTTVSPVEVVANLTLNLTATVLPTNADDKSVTWSSADTEIATVSSTGVVTGVAPGTVAITATSVAAPLISGSISVVVLPAPLNLSAIDLTVTRTALKVGASEPITATYLPLGYVGAGITFASSDNAIATVTSAGIIQARATGTVTITGTATEDTTKTDSLELTITAADLIPAVKTAVVDTQVSANGIITKIMASNELYFQVGEDAMHVLGPAATFSTVGFSEGDFVQVSGPVKNTNAPRRIGTSSGVVVLMTKIDFLPVPTVTPLVITEATYNTTDVPASNQWRVVQINNLFPPQPWVNVTTTSATNRIFKLGDANVDVRISNFINSAELLGLNTLFSDFWKNDRVNYNGILSFFSGNLQLLTAGAKDFTLIEADAVPVTSVTVTAAGEATKVVVGNTLQLNAAVLPANADSLDVTWSSSDDLLATISETGLVTGVAVGNVTFTATSVFTPAISGSITLPVELAPASLDSIVIKNIETSLEIGRTLTLDVDYLPEGFNGTGFTFESNDVSKATVSTSGVVTGVALGSVTITATSKDDVTKTASLALTIIETVPVTVFSSNFGTSGQTGYAVGNINVVDSISGTTFVSAKDRLQTNTSSTAPHATMGAFAVFAPISGATYSYMTLDFTGVNAMNASFDYSVWSATVLTNFGNVIDTATLRIEKLNDTTWDTVSSLNVIGLVSATEYQNTSMLMSGQGVYRISFTIVAKSGSTLATTNTAYALTLDNLVIKDA
jgi:uncharacterized protein YjdB